MKYLGFLAVLAAGFLSVASGPAHAMPVKLSFSGSILGLSECNSISPNCIQDHFEPALGGIFAAGQLVTGSITYDTASLEFSSFGASGLANHRGVVPELVFSVATGAGNFFAEIGPFSPLPGVTDRGIAFVCGEPTCVNSRGSQFVNLQAERLRSAPPLVADTILINAALGFENNQNLLSSSALLPGEELLSIAAQSTGYLFLAFAGENKCTVATRLCGVVAEISVLVPEPSSGGLAVIGLVGMTALRR